jgi:hypothetical protein
MPINYTALKSELQNDPQALGYATYISSGADENLAVILNTVRGTITLLRDSVPRRDVFDAFVPTEVAALSSVQLQALELVMLMDPVNFASANTRTFLANIFPIATAPTTHANLVALATRNGSRAEQLFGIGTVITNQDVRKALSS